MKKHTKRAETADRAVRDRLEESSTSEDDKTEHSRQHKKSKLKSNDSRRRSHQQDCVSDPSL